MIGTAEIDREDRPLDRRSDRELLDEYSRTITAVAAEVSSSVVRIDVEVPAARAQRGPRGPITRRGAARASS
jgi:hypothetical protein